MSAAISTGAIFVIALILAGTGPRRGRMGALAALAALLLAAAAVQLTRSNYVALVVAGIVGIAVHLLRGGSLTGVNLRAAVAVLLTVAIVSALGSLDIGAARISSAATAVVQRAESTVSSATTDSGNLGYRTQLDGVMLQALGSKWPVGLGFLDPTVRYYPELPDGSIRNADVGVFNVLMTMGVIGAVLMYGPLLLGMKEAVRAARVAGRDRRWIAYGGAAWIAWMLVGSWNLVVMFSVGGVVVSALTLGFILRACARIGEHDAGV